jgi:hypothetical protein
MNRPNAKITIDGIEYKVKFVVTGVDLNATMDALGITNPVKREEHVDAVIKSNKNIKNNYVRLQKEVHETPNGNSGTDPAYDMFFRVCRDIGANTGYWSTDQQQQTGTTYTHEHNHGLGGDDHPEATGGNGGNGELSIDVTLESQNYVAKQNFTKNKDGYPRVNVRNREVFQRNINAIFTPEVRNNLETKGKSDVGKITNVKH